MKQISRVLVVPATAVLALAVSTGAAFGDVVADYELNEQRGASTMIDSSGNGLHGTLGDDVVTGVATTSSLGYSFPGGSGYDPQNLVNVPDDPRLDPGTSAYAVTIRFRTTAAHPNIVQKGQSGQTGGFWKLVLKEGWPRCHFRDSAGRTKAIGFVDGPREYKLDDGQWNTVRCERTTTGTRVTINYGEPGAVSKFIRGTLGTIDNRRPLSFGGKTDCAASGVGCDYFRGLVDWLTIEKS